ncbi:hypothetical protein CAOG_01046 [Capsaspora owczarzaki ATCC 30864]|uniref:Mitochondrial fission process protein 1 n=1 Tax=Capsaspora owczarzaki (strain ATCC 30864) TaxID=595528 RepID=A0A0D2U382_CAPO3|nr:hypothetical protein CAOG_01046 [Capsaspora owczarzaki ATCC 30864]KJE89611.1 hypothetical protein CAOG_001046 [Capsaspora owczarzaki ATCC 30864]|eukprot:XP_004365917.2 hypothetical protein CAOG_01046 [Capsaspora owczarzaki ATCC 30864]
MPAQRWTSAELYDGDDDDDEDAEEQPVVRNGVQPATKSTSNTTQGNPPVLVSRIQALFVLRRFDSAMDECRRALIQLTRATTSGADSVHTPPARSQATTTTVTTTTAAAAAAAANGGRGLAGSGSGSDSRSGSLAAPVGNHSAQCSPTCECLPFAEVYCMLATRTHQTSTLLPFFESVYGRPDDGSGVFDSVCCHLPPRVVIAVATALKVENDSPAAKSLLELYLVGADFSRWGLDGAHQDQYERLVELYTLHVLAPAGLLTQATAFLESNTALNDERRQEKALAAQLAIELQRSSTAAQSHPSGAESSVAMPSLTNGDRSASRTQQPPAQPQQSSILAPLRATQPAATASGLHQTLSVFRHLLRSPVGLVRTAAMGLALLCLISILLVLRRRGWTGRTLLWPLLWLWLLNMATQTVPAIPANQSSSNKPVDLFRNTHVRYLGYANELGEAFRAFIPVQLVRASYVAAFGYGLADATHKSLAGYARQSPASHTAAIKAATAGVPGLSSISPTGIQAIESFVDTALWQTAATVLIPGFTINRTCALTSFLLARYAPTVGEGMRKAMTTVVGLGVIPLIIHPIDSFVDQTMDKTYRAWVKEHLFGEKP